MHFLTSSQFAKLKFFRMVWKFQTVGGNFRLELGTQKICKMESHYSKFYTVFKQAVLYLDLWRFGRIRVRWNRWRMGRRGGRKRNNSGKNELELISHYERVLERSFPTNFWDQNCWKVICLYFQDQEKNLIYRKGNKKVPQWWGWTHNDTGKWLLREKIGCYWQCLETRATRYWNFCCKRHNLWPITDVSLAMWQIEMPKI